MCRRIHLPSASPPPCASCIFAKSLLRLLLFKFYLRPKIRLTRQSSSGDLAQDEAAITGFRVHDITVNDWGHLGIQILFLACCLRSIWDQQSIYFGPKMIENRHLEVSWRLFGWLLGPYGSPKLPRGSPESKKVVRGSLLDPLVGPLVGSIFGS